MLVIVHQYSGSFIGVAAKIAVRNARSIRFHDLRHTAATLLLASGVNVKVVSEMLGHSSVSINLSIYAHVLPHMQQSAVNAMDRLFGPVDYPTSVSSSALPQGARPPELEA